MAWRPFRNAGLKMAALALGTLLWFTVTSDEVERLVEVPIAIRNLPAGLEITEQPQGVEVRVRGSAAELLARRRIGGLIAIEREIGLRSFVESGIPVDATVSYDLLTTIFQPGTPLHDGAVIIQEDRIAAASCFLPLAVHPKLDRDLGTRHRAAIGLTEESDAVAVVVSEERGEISLSLQGRLYRGLSPDELRTRLQVLIAHERAPKPVEPASAGVDA